MVENIFKYAVENKLRFPYYKGQITVEDLFDIDLPDLDFIFKNLNSQVKKANEESLMETKTTKDETLDVQIAIVKTIFSQKKAEKEAKDHEKEIKEQKQHIAQILANKKNEALNNMSVEELEKMMSELV